MTKLYAVRGATTIEKDCKSEIEKATIELMQEIIAKNAIKADEAVSLIATITHDIKSVVPVYYIRQNKILGDMPVFCALEPDIQGALPLCIRILLHFQKEGEHKPVPVYLRGAKVLRPDLKENHS